MKTYVYENTGIEMLYEAAAAENADFACVYDLAAADRAALDAAMELERAREAADLALIADFEAAGASAEVRDAAERELIWANAALELAQEAFSRTGEALVFAAMDFWERAIGEDRSGPLRCAGKTAEKNSAAAETAVAAA